MVLAFLLLWESLHPFFELFDASPRERLKHGGRNMLVAVINALLVSFIFVGLWAWAAGYSSKHQLGLLHQFALDPWVRLALVILLLDGWTYLWHWMNHRLPVLWRFHRMHHADTQMDVTTAGRFHLGEIIFSSLLRLPIILLLGVQLHELVVYEVMMFAVVQFHHANIGLPEKWDRLLRLVIVTPAMHKVHHSNQQLETDSNYTSLFSWWDRIFGTFRLRRDPHTIQFGLDQTPAKDVQSMRAMMKTPFAELPGTSRGVSVKWVWFSFIAALLATAGCVMMLRDTTMTWDKTYQMIERDFPGVPVITNTELAQWLADADRKPPLL
ncbi:MAG: sterol desaturase family protein, partial [Phycisphaerales bacterium]|nr:sterol desaturase family protein [Phycisphaerales bacterium]